MVVKDENTEQATVEVGKEELLSLDSLKHAAKGLEKSISGSPIEHETLQSVVKAIKECKDIPENLIRGLTLVVASNVFNNKISPSHAPFSILEALFAVDYVKTVEFFNSAISKQLQSTTFRVIYDKRMGFVRIWLLNSLAKHPEKLPLSVVADTLIIIAEISLHLPDPSKKLFGIHKKIDLTKLAEILDSKISSDSWKVMCVAALLLNTLVSERKRRVEKCEQNGTVDPNRHLFAKLWLKAFINAYFTVKVYPGDGVFYFENGQNAFKYLEATDLDDSFRSALKKCFLRMPEVALPTLSNLLTIEHSFPAEIINLIVELIPDTFSSTNDLTHEYASKIISHLLYFVDSNKRKTLLDSIFGKQSKVKGRNDYVVSLERFLHTVYAGYADKSLEYLNQFVSDILAFLEIELQSIKSDSASSNHIRVFAALSSTINAKSESIKKYIDLAASIFKQPINTFPICCTFAAKALVTCDVQPEHYPIILLDSIKPHIALFGNASASADFVFYTTLLFFKLAREEKNRGKTDPLFVQILNSDAYLKEKLQTGLSVEAISYGYLFVRDFFVCLNALDQQTISKLPKSPSIVRFLLLLLEWHGKLKIHPSFKVEQYTLMLRPTLLSWLFSIFSDFLNTGEFTDIFMKQVDSFDPNNLFDRSQVLLNSKFINKLATILREYVNSQKVNENELTELIYNTIILANNTVYHDEALLKNLSSYLLQTEQCKSILFGAFFDLGYIEKVYALAPLRCRQNSIGFLIELESENNRHRDFAWKKCLECCAGMEIQKLNDVDDNEAAIFFTPNGTLYNEGIIDEYSDAVLDKHNIRRENKAYKFKDQIAEIELRKELAEKNKREGKLTSRQQEAIKKELAKETETRKELSPIYVAPKNLHELLPIVIKSDPNGALKNYEIFNSFVVPTLKSTLIGKLMLDCVKTYEEIFFTDSSDFLGDRILSAILRSARSPLTLPEWTWETFPDQISKVFSSLQMLCMMNDLLTGQDALEALEQLNAEENDESSFNEGITLGKLSFVVPVLERVYTDPKIDERLRLEATNFLKAAFALDFLTVEEREWIPIKLINELLLKVMCDSNNVDYFDDVFELMKGILTKLNQENSTSENAGDYVKRLTEKLRNPNEIIREHVSKLLMHCKDIISHSFIKANDIAHSTIILIAKNDVYRQSDNHLHELVEELGMAVTLEMHDHILEELKYPYQFWQKAASNSLSLLFTKETIEELAKMYNKLQAILPAVKDKVGRVIEPERNQWPSRRGIAIALEFYIDSDFYDISLFEDLVKFLVPTAINDVHDLVRQAMYKAASSLISKNGASRVDFVLPHLENLLLALPNTAENDVLRNGLVCLLGTLARYLQPDSPKLRTIFARLLDALMVPSKQVQESVALCIPPLAKLLKDHALDELKRLFRSLPQGKVYAERCGYAYGVAGLTKGLGLATLKEISFLETILGWFESKDVVLREAACLVFLTMCFVHRRAFDPYIKKLLQSLIKSFGDSDTTVQLAARDAGSQMMQTISPAAVRVFLPEILGELDSDAWRAKCASADFLANISNCAPAQLSECLPKVVPGLALLVTDSHHKVKSSGVNALRQIATVITNPEILAISSHLIEALVEPAKMTTRALQIIVNTKFVHYIDPPSLALMMPIVKRALNDRESDGRRMGSNIVSNIFSIADERHVEPYMEMLIPNLKHSLLDPAPEVRSSSAQAIGAIVRHNTSGVFSSYTTSLIPWLKERMMSKSSMVDRLGASQGLAEVISAFEEGTEAVMSQAIEFTADANNDPAMRDGYIRLFTYLPSTMGERFIPYIERVIPSILLALSDETEYLRNSALHTGQILISTYCSQAKRYLLPSLLEGCINESWRIRHAAVTLIGDFLFNISGISSKMSSDTGGEDETFGLAAVDKTIVKYVGQKTRDKIIISLYLARFDSGVQVRQASSHVWKLVVSNTPRTVKELLPDLFELIVECISSSTEDRRHMAVECLSEVVRKMGDRIFESLMPEVEKAVDVERDVEHRRGAIEALATIINSVPSSEVFEIYNKNIVNIFRTSLCDPDLRLRQSSGETFAVYYNKVGIAALEEIVDPFFNDYLLNESEEVLDGIVALLSVNRRGRVLNVPDLVKRILKFKSKAYVFSRLVDVISDTIERNFIQIFTELFKDQPTPLTDEYFGQCATLLKAIRNNYTIVGMFKFLALRAVEGDILAGKLMIEMIKLDAVREETLAMLVENSLLLYTSQHIETQIFGNKLLSLIIGQCSGNEILEIPTYLCSFIVGVRNESKSMNGLNVVPGGWKPFIDLLAACSRTGSIEQRETIVHAISDLLQMTNPDALRPVTPSIVAIILRLLADQCPTMLKAYSVSAVGTLMEKVPQSIRVFAPQLTNFMKRILQEAEDDFRPDTVALSELTEKTLEEIQTLVPSRT